MKKYKVYFVTDAEEDLFEIYKYVASSDSKTKAQTLLNKLEQTCKKLSQFPERGHYPPELERIGIFSYKEIHYKPYRIIYQVIGQNVYIHCILDGRRDLQQILQERIIR
ncbi:MAG: type II toxin-antitoxin system RelE/ParE family toxin [Bacteroidetes bacterium]|nr:MAG: type II toxin-antitoxin system RelE/ParE family toxin [Bacteroidota bacterium]